MLSNKYQTMAEMDANEANVNVRILIGLPATWQPIISADIYVYIRRLPVRVLKLGI